MASPIIETNDTNFDNDLKHSGENIFLFFYAVFADDICKKMDPEIEYVANEYKGRVTFLRTDIDYNGSVLARFKIAALPYVIFIRRGAIVAAEYRFMDKDELKNLIESKIYMNLVH